MSLRALYDVPAPAKLNLFLHVIGRRADGYHLLQSVFLLIDWCDTLHFERRDDGRLARHDLGASLPNDDLCLRAARLLSAESGCAFGVDISINKQLPTGAGMGGGSSDAATTLLALNRLWGLNWPRERLQALGLMLGADVPFFIGGHNAFVEGVGELLTPLEISPAWFAVLKPPSSIETRAIFGSPRLVRNSEAVILEGLAVNDFREVSIEMSRGVRCVSVQQIADGFGRNDLQAAAEWECSQVSEALAVLNAHFGNGRMTGSGSAVFAKANFAGVDGAEVEGEGNRPPMPDLPAPGWAGKMCRSLKQHPLVGWAENEV